MRKYSWIFLLFYCVSAWAATLTWKDLQAGIDSWIAGPPSLVITDQEKEVFKRLKTAEEKMQFIKIFWARRDPILRTRENEYKEEFYRRVQHANENFAEGETPGWKTARGQVYILFGPPQREEKKLVPDSTRPALLWVYNKIPSNKIPPNEALLFVHREIKWVLVPPNADPGDYFGELQRELD
ncbi:MAG TPA: GWxTD domain-containing protein, partial [Acidobacteriota bacterium]|nr:GWxTD domain-containing protein [Acidobacteriota bacterium]